MRAGAGLLTAGMRAHQPHLEPSSDFRKLRIDPTPRVVEDVGACLADLLAHFMPPGVNADDDRIVFRSHCFDKVDRASDLFFRINEFTRTRFDSTDVNDVRTFINRAVDRGHRRIIAECGPTVIKRIGRAIDDGHDEQVSGLKSGVSQGQ